LKNYLTPAKAKKGAAPAAEVEPPTHATVYVAKSYPPWQCIILDTLRYAHNHRDTYLEQQPIEIHI
jgi:leucyl-tRNA synthetase